MWVIASPFDGEALNEVGFQSTTFFFTHLSHTKISNTHKGSGVESKLLKSGKAYHIGRKDCDLIVNHKKVSHDHGEFVVGRFSPDDVVRLVWYPTSALADNGDRRILITCQRCGF